MSEVRGRSQVALLGVCAALMLIPVTLPVPVLRSLVQERFAASDFATSAFMSINMVGALITAPMIGTIADRFGRAKALIVIALAIDSLCFFALTADVSFGAFLAIRFVEGCAHIAALSLLLAIAARIADEFGSGKVMGVVGAGITLGVATGAPIGGQIGRDDPLMPLYVGGMLLAGLAVLAALFLRDRAVQRERPSLRSLFGFAKREPELIAPLSFAFVDRFTVGFFTTTFPLYLKNVHDLPADRIGMLLGMFLGPFALLSYPFGRLAELTSRVRMLAGGSLVYGVGVTTLGFWDVGMLPILMVTLGILSAVMFVPSLMLTTDLARPEIRSMALGGFNAAGSLGFITGPLVGGFVTQFVANRSDAATGYASAFVVAGAAEVLCVLFALQLLRRLVAAGRTT